MLDAPVNGSAAPQTRDSPRSYPRGEKLSLSRGGGGMQ